MMNSLKLVFAGTPEFGLPVLEALIDSTHQLQAIYTQPDRPAGRGRSLQASAVKQWALAHDLPVYQPLNFKSQESIDSMHALNPDVLVVIAYGLILPKSVLDIPRLGCINVHASLLPRWRGASPIQQAILHGDKQSGVTIMQMDVGMDTGDMLQQEQCAIEPWDTAGSLHDKLAQCSVQPLLSTLDALAAQTAQAKAQNNELATYANKLSKAQALINWQDSAQTIDRTVRAFNPWPIAYTLIDETPLRIHQAKPTPIVCTERPGTVLTVDKQGILVATAHQSILLEKIQFPGAKALMVSQWLNAGKKEIYPGLRLR